MKHAIYKNMKVILPTLLLSGLAACNSSVDSNETSINAQKVALGKQIFFDTDLSNPAGQACSSCHQPNAGFADSDNEIPVSRGIHPERFGNRNTPSVAYAAFSPEFYFDDIEGIFFGGQFLDGRASTLEEQAKRPFLNPVEMANTDTTSVVQKVGQSIYADEFKAVYGDEIFSDVERAFNSIADALASFERSDELAAFSSKFDLFMAGQTTLSAQELRGLDIFNRTDKGNCAACHPGANEAVDTPALFTDFSYDNLGTPANPNSPFLTQSSEYNPEGLSFIDFGLGARLGNNAENGKFKVPSLRNVNLTGPYMHNGVFATLEEVLDFYSDRDADGVIPEVAENVNRSELGALALSDQEKLDIIAFLKTLTDGFIIE